MRSNTARIAVAVGAIAALVVLFIVLSGGDDNNNNNDKTSTTSTSQAGTQSQTPAPAVINVVDGKPAGGIQELDYEKGDRIRLRVDSDVSDEIHVHGYDLHKDVEAGGSASFSFPATIEGVFEIELEGQDEQIGELRVRPS